MSLLLDLDKALFCDPLGNYASSKIAATCFQGLLLNAFWQHDDHIMQNWDILSLFVVAFLAPDILKKIITLKFGAGASTSETTTAVTTTASTTQSTEAGK